MSEPNGNDDPYVPPQKPDQADLVHPGSCLKVLLIWGSPAIVVPLLVVLLAAAWPVAVILAVAFLIWMGRISATDTSGRPGFDKNPQTGRVVLYVVLQLLLIPLFWFAVGWAFCGSGKFI